jgi:hypothetical protein
VRRQPGCHQHDGRPPGVREQHERAGKSANGLNHVGGDEVHGDRQRRAGHAEVEVARDDQVARELRILEVAHARRAHACVGQSVVEPGRGAIAEIGADGLVHRRHDLEQYEHDADEAQRPGEAIAALDGADEHAHRDAEHGRQHAAQQEQRPPGDRDRTGGFGQDREERPFLPIAKTLQHGRILPDPTLHRL